MDSAEKERRNREIRRNLNFDSNRNQSATFEFVDAAMPVQHSPPHSIFADRTVRDLSNSIQSRDGAQAAQNIENLRNLEIEDNHRRRSINGNILDRAGNDVQIPTRNSFPDLTRPPPNMQSNQNLVQLDAEEASNAQGPIDNGSRENALPSEIVSAINAAVAQAHESFRASQNSVLEETMRSGFVSFMKEINDLIRPLQASHNSQIQLGENSTASRDIQPDKTVQAERNLISSIPQRSVNTSYNNCQYYSQDKNVEGETRPGNIYPNTSSFSVRNPNYGAQQQIYANDGICTGAHSRRNEANLTKPQLPHGNNGQSTRLVFQGQVHGQQHIPTQGTSNDGNHQNMSGVNQRQNFETHQQLPTINTGSYRINNNYLRVDKWDVIFDGDRNKMTVEDFIFRVEYLQERYQVDWSEILRDFHRLVGGQVKDWYWLFVKNNFVPNWLVLKSALLKQFQGHSSDFELMRELVERKQLPGELIDNYFHVMQKLRSRLKVPISDYDMVRILKRNLRENLARLVFSIPVYSLEELRIECHEAEMTFLRREGRSFQPQQTQPRYQARAHVNEVFDENEQQGYAEDANFENIDAVHNERSIQNRQPLRVLECWNCDVKGHTFVECSAPRVIFCYKCGLKGVITPKCPNCSGGNSKGGVMKAGESRLSQRPKIVEG